MGEVIDPLRVHLFLERDISPKTLKSVSLDPQVECFSLSFWNHAGACL